MKNNCLLLVNISWHGVVWQFSPHQTVDVVQNIKQIILFWAEIDYGE